MKKTLIYFAISAVLFACNNANEEGKDSVEKADSANEAKRDSTPDVIQTDAATTDFLVKAANGGLTEVEMGRMAESKATDPGVKRFAAMMVNDHTAANNEVKSLAAARNVSIPSTPSEEHQKDMAKFNDKTGKNFDKDYMDMMVDDHQETIKLFEKTNDDTKDEQVRTFINNTLPKLRMHLDSAQAIRKALKK